MMLTSSDLGAWGVWARGNDSSHGVASEGWVRATLNPKPQTLNACRASGPSELYDEGGPKHFARLQHGPCKLEALGENFGVWGLRLGV